MASSTSKLEVETEVKSPADKIWGSIRDSTTLFPKIFPDHYTSIEVLEGDGKSVGSIRLLKFSKDMPGVTFSKEKIDAVDEAKKMVAYDVIDGDHSNLYKSFKCKLDVIPKGGGSLVKWCCEYEKASVEVPDPNIVQELAVKNSQALDAYLLKA